MPTILNIPTILAMATFMVIKTVEDYLLNKLPIKNELVINSIIHFKNVNVNSIINAPHRNTNRKETNIIYLDPALPLTLTSIMQCLASISHELGVFSHIVNRLVNSLNAYVNVNSSKISYYDEYYIKNSGLYGYHIKGTDGSETCITEDK